MKLKYSLKLKSTLALFVYIIITIIITYCVLNVIYFTNHKKDISEDMIHLMKTIEKYPYDIPEFIDWTARNLNHSVYLYEDVEEMLHLISLDVNKDDLLSQQDIAKLEEGELITNQLSKNVDNTPYTLLTFFYPVMKNDTLHYILFTYYPVLMMPEEDFLYFLMNLLLTLLVIAITFVLTKKSFRKSYLQLQDIKQAAIQVSNGNFDTKIWQNSSDEVGEITEVFNNMSVALKDDRNRIQEFMEDISHEIKTPLTYIKTYNQALLDGIIQDPKEQHKSYSLIDRETTRLQSLIQNFLDFTKLDAHAVELNRQPMAFAESIEYIMVKYEPIFHQKNITFHMDLDYEVIIYSDEERIEQVIQNIIQNAIRYSKEQLHIKMVLEQHADTCVLAISDNGIGISDEHLSVITNRFIRVNKVCSRKESGTGIGLSIVEKIMDLHGGKLLIESQLGIGTTVKLIFPILKSEEQIS